MKKTILVLVTLLSCFMRVNANTKNNDPVILAPSVPDFSASVESACVGQTVAFTDMSVGPAIKWLWKFEGASPLTSQLQNPVVTYTASGTLSATLTVTFEGDGDQTVIKTEFIK